MRRRQVIALLLTAAGWSGAARAQPGAAGGPRTRPIRLGYVSWWPPSLRSYVDSLRQGLRDLGYVEGRDIVIEAHFTDGDRARTQDVVRTLVASPVDILVVSTTPAALIVREATRTIPVVMASVSDPLAVGLAQSLARPGGNFTGLSSYGPDLAGKRLQLLQEISPRIRSIAFLGSSRDANAATFLRGTQAAADRLGLALTVRLVDNLDAIDAAIFETMKRQGAEAVVVQPIFTGHQDRIVGLAAQAQLPVIADYRFFAQAGALMTYGIDDPAQMRRAAGFVDRILRGGNPAEMPIEQPTKFRLVVNRRTAAAFGIDIPESVLLQADEVIE
jgi:putative tryptophan/tyrosine transport system substrate-binding protein